MTPEDWKILARHGVTPDNLRVEGSLYLDGTGITSLPDNLHVGGWLYLSGTAIAALPDNLHVGGWLDLDGTAIAVIFTDERRYRLRQVRAGRSGEWWVAGCRVFRSRADALAHWGSPQYPDPDRGAAFCAAINATPEIGAHS